IDYTDMLYLPAVWRLPARWRSDWVFVDECLTGDTPVRLTDGSERPIKELVEERARASVLAYNERDARVESRPIIGWPKLPRRGRRIVRIGRMQATEDHPVYTAEAGYLAAGRCLSHDVRILELSREDARCGRGAQGTGTLGRGWVATWRPVSPPGRTEDDTWRRQDSAHALTSATSRAGMQDGREAAMGPSVHRRAAQAGRDESAHRRA